MVRSIAINVAANTNLPGFRGPVYPDGRFEYVPIPERKATAESVPTYADLDLSFDVPADVAEVPVHLDPEFAGVHGSENHTYGDEHGVKAGPLSELDRGDYLLFYATLEVVADGWIPGGEAASETSGSAASPAAEWLPPTWGAFLIGEFRVDRILTGAAYETATAAERAEFESNAHVKRAPFDAKVLVAGDDASGLYDRAIPLSSPSGGATANALVTDLSNDSGKGPWWRRRLWYDADATAELRRIIDGWPDVPFPE